MDIELPAYEDIYESLSEHQQIMQNLNTSNKISDLKKENSIKILIMWIFVILRGVDYYQKLNYIFDLYSPMHHKIDKKEAEIVVSSIFGSFGKQSISYIFYILNNVKITPDKFQIFLIIFKRTLFTGVNNSLFKNVKVLTNLIIVTSLSWHY